MLEKLPFFRFLSSPMLGFTTLQDVPSDIKLDLQLNKKGSGYWQGNTLCIPDGGSQGMYSVSDDRWYNIYDYDTPSQNKRGDAVPPRAVMVDGNGKTVAHAFEDSQQNGKPGVFIRNLRARLVYHGLRRG